MTTTRSPLEILEAILDEVDSPHKLDRRSFLPRVLVAEAREALPATPHLGATSGGALSDEMEMVGRTVAHAWSCGLKRGDLAISFADGCFIAFEAEVDGCGESAYIVASSSMGQKLSEFVEAHELRNAGLIDQAECDALQRAEADKRAAAARRRLADAQRAVELAEKHATRAA